MNKAEVSGVKYSYRIALNTYSDVKKFVETATKAEGKLVLKSGEKFTVNAKSLLGVLLASKLNWSDLTLVSDKDCYFDFKQFIVIE
jgi:hypothetical protein